MSTPITIVGGIKSTPHIPRRTKFVNLHEDLLREVNKVFASQPLDQGGGGLNPPRPPKYFGLLLVHPGRPPLPPNKSYHRPFNYLEYVKDFDPNVHVRVFKVVFRTNNETNDAKMIDMFSFTLKDIMFDWCNNYLRDYPYCTFVEL